MTVPLKWRRLVSIATGIDCSWLIYRSERKTVTLCSLAGEGTVRNECDSTSFTWVSFLPKQSYEDSWKRRSLKWSSPSKLHANESDTCSARLTLDH
jgi:hypothetical protein